MRAWLEAGSPSVTSKVPGRLNKESLHRHLLPPGQGPPSYEPAHGTKAGMAVAAGAGEAVPAGQDTEGLELQLESLL